MQGLANVFGEVVDMASHFETVQTGLSTVLQSVDRGKELFEDLRKYSFETTFGMDELADSATQFLNVGMKVKDLKENLGMIGDLAQGDKTKFAELSSIFAKINSTGKASSLQIRQIAMKGIPIIQTLKEMGIQGSASAEDLTKAFKKLTDEGGQFHGAMSLIIDTIEGKRGFISDTIKEILVNFGELSGITDTYKLLLDVVYEVLNKVNEKLIEWNKNPMMKNLVRGVVLSSVGALAGFLAGTLIPTLVTIVTLLSAIDPTIWARLAIGAGIGAALGVTAGLGINAAVQKQIDLRNETEKTNKKLKEQRNLLKFGKYDDYFDYSISETQKELQNKKDWIEVVAQDYFKKRLFGVTTIQSARQKALENTNKSYSSTGDKTTTQLEQDLIVLKKYQREYSNLVEKYNLVDMYTPEADSTDERIKELKKQIEEMYSINKTLNVQYDDKGNITSLGVALSKDEETARRVRTAIHEAEKELRKLEGKLNFRDIIEEKLGIKIDADSNGISEIQNYIKTLQGKMATEIQAATEIAKLEKTESALPDTIRQIRTEYASLMDSLIDSLVKEGGFNDSIKTIIETLLKGKKDLSGTSYMTTGEAVGGNIKEKFSKASGDWQAFSEGMQLTGSAKGAIIYTLINSLGNILLEIDGIDKILNPITNMMRELIPLLEPLVEIVGDIMSIAEALVKVVIQWLDPVISGLNEFANWLTEFMGLNEELQNEKEKESELIKQMNEQMISLTQAMQEQEEYYYKMNKQIFNQAYADKAVSVNDMILTPNGTFSTNPQDTIIATKNPQSLGSTNVQNKIIVNNNANVEVEAEQKVDENGINQIFINISKKIAQDYADGRNGWELAKVLSTSNAVGRRVLG